jgi:hypothetical protein
MLEFTRTEYENLKKSKELDEFSPAQFHAWVNSNEDLFMKGESGEFDNDLQKSEYNTLQNELAAFVKVGVWEEDKQSTIVKSEYFIREKQVDFANEITKSENGEDETITKGIYRDTALNRKLGRVGTEFGSQIQKSKSMPIGTIHNGFKKIAEGKWRKVSEHGMTQREHKDTAYKHEDAAVRTKPTSDKGEDDRVYAEEYKAKKHKELASKLDSKDYSDEEVGLGVHKKGDKLEHNGETIHVGHDTSGGQSTITYKAPSVSDKTYYDLDKLKKVIEENKVTDEQRKTIQDRMRSKFNEDKF